MAVENVSNVGGMRPQMGSTTLTLPVTFDYSGGRRDSKKSRKVWAVILTIAGVIFGFGIIFNKDGFFLTNLIMGVVSMYIIGLIIRFPLLRESKIRKEYINLVDADYRRETNDFWGIFSVEDGYPYYCRFRNGKSGLFIRLNKDVILGKYSESEFEHYEAISDAYNLAGQGKVQMCHIDYMDNVGTDDRLEESFISLSEVKNPDLKDVLTDIFSFQQAQMMQRVTTFDTYLFLWTGSDINAWSTIQRILCCFLEANYRSYHILDSSDLRELPKVLFNLHDFSVIDAMSTAFVTTGYAGVVPLKVEKGTGEVEILGKTIEEKAEERQLKIKEQEMNKQELKRRKVSKKNKKKKQEEKEIDLF